MNLKPGTRVLVKPIVFFPKKVGPAASWVPVWHRLHKAVREKYSLMLKGRDTFELAPVRVMNGALSPAQYRELCFLGRGLVGPDELNKDEGEGCSQGVETILTEILSKRFEDGRRYSRYTLPFCLSVLMVDPDRQWGSGGGRNLNGDANLGGGILVIPSWHIEDGTFTSTLVHELGHTFGLVHSSDRGSSSNWFKLTRQYLCYYDIDRSPSVMSYNLSNHTNATTAVDIPGCLLGDEIHALNGNRHVFPNLFFDATNDFGCGKRRGCPPHDKKVREVYLGPMTLLWCTTEFESGYGAASNLGDTPSRWILSSNARTGFVANRMWRSSKANPEGWVSLDVTFPMAVDLNRVIVYTEHSGKKHRATGVQIERESSGVFTFVKRVKSKKRDTHVEFPTKKAWRWRIALKAGSSKFVTVRGFRFFKNDYEWFPPLGPFAMTDFGETYKSRVSNLVEIQRLIRANGPSVGFDPRSMWHSGKTNAKGWVSIEITFPVQVHLSRIQIYSQHSGIFHRAKRVQVEASDDKGNYAVLAAKNFSKATGSITFSAHRAKTWKLAFKGDDYVVIRGLRFFIGDEEFYPPSVVG